MKDKFDRELSVGDLCFRIVGAANRFARPSLKVVKVQDFTASKVKLGTRCFVDSGNLVKASSEDLEKHII
jgi:hypothetical protein